MRLGHIPHHRRNCTSCVRDMLHLVLNALECLGLGVLGLMSGSRVLGVWGLGCRIGSWVLVSVSGLGSRALGLGFGWGLGESRVLGAL